MCKLRKIKKQRKSNFCKTFFTLIIYLYFWFIETRCQGFNNIAVVLCNLEESSTYFNHLLIVLFLSLMSDVFKPLMPYILNLLLLNISPLLDINKIEFIIICQHFIFMKAT